jgi:hypothetical protein
VRVRSFTSRGASLTENARIDEQLANAPEGVYMFIVQGTKCHRVCTLPPMETRTPSCVQMHVFDIDMEAEANKRRYIMDGCGNNPACPKSRELHRRNVPASWRIYKPRSSQRLIGNSCRPPGVHLRTHNRQMCNEMAAILLGRRTRYFAPACWGGGGGLAAVATGSRHTIHCISPLVDPHTGELGLVFSSSV